MASWGGRLLLKSAHWARESCLSETRFLGRQQQEQRSEKPGGPPEKLGVRPPRSRYHMTLCQSVSRGQVALHSSHRALRDRFHEAKSMTVKVINRVLAGTLVP